MTQEEEKYVWGLDEQKEWNQKLEEWWPQHERNKIKIEEGIDHSISKADYLKVMKCHISVVSAKTRAELTHAAIDWDLNIGDGRMCLEWGLLILDNGGAACPDDIQELDNQIAYELRNKEQNDDR